MNYLKRRQVLAAAGAFLTAPLAAWAQQSAKMPIVGFLVLANPEPVFGYFKEGMRKLGYVESRNLQIVFRSAEGKAERLAGLAAELVRLKVDVIVAVLTPAVIAAMQATKQIPIVMSGAGDPVATGLVASLARPGGNVTGTASTATEVAGKNLEYFLGIMPNAKRVGVLANAVDPFTPVYVRQIQLAGASLSLEIAPIMIRDSSEFGAAFRDMVNRRTNVVMVQPSLQRKIAADMALKHRLPAIASNGAFPDEGGLLSFSANVAEIHLGTGAYVDKILKGAKPADLPVQQPTKFELVINLKIAKALGLTIPQSLLLRADRVIE